MEAREADRFAGSFLVYPDAGIAAYPDCLDLSDHRMKRLPEELRLVEGFLQLDYCRELSSIEGPLVVSGGLSAEGCVQLKRVGGAIRAAAVNLKGCKSLRHVAADFDTGILDLSGCERATSLPDGLDLMYLDLTGCRGLEELPADIQVSEALWLDGCTELKSLPAGLETCSLFLDGCTTLKCLSRGLKVRDFLSLTDCVSIDALPEDLLVGGESSTNEGFLDLSGCFGLEQHYCLEPERIRGLAMVAVGFSLSNWLELTELPEHLELSGSLSLNGCSNLRELPAGLRIGDCLDLSDCASLKTLPEDIYVGGEICVPHALFSSAVGLLMRGNAGSVKTGSR